VLWFAYILCGSSSDLHGLASILQGMPRLDERQARATHRWSEIHQARIELATFSV
jgi:hypothetical protein